MALGVCSEGLFCSSEGHRKPKVNRTSEMVHLQKRSSNDHVKLNSLG